MGRFRGVRAQELPAGGDRAEEVAHLDGGPARMAGVSDPRAPAMEFRYTDGGGWDMDYQTDEE